MGNISLQVPLHSAETYHIIPHTTPSPLLPERMIYLLFGTVLVSSLLVEFYCSTLPDLISLLREISSLFSRKWIAFTAFAGRPVQIVHDFRSGKLYKPWGRKKPVLVRNADHMLQLSDAPELSQRAVYADIFGFKYTMKHTTVDLDPNEQTAARYRLYSRAIRIIGMAQISSLQPYLQARMQETLYRHVDARDSTDGWTSIQLAPLMRDMAGDMLGLYFFGPKLSAEPEFNWALQRYYSDTVKFGGALQLVPGFVASYAYSRITNQGKALQVLFERLRSAMDSKNPNWDEDKNVKSMTLMQNLIESSRESSYWTPDLLIQAIIGIWFAASHQPWINLHFMFLELCTRPEYVRLIRDEIDAQECLDYTHISKMPILDSFMKESVRLNPLDTMSIRRKALKPFTFSDGRTHVAPGEIACAPAWEIMHNEAKYPNPNAFEGLRFVKDLPLPTSTFASGMRNEPMRGTTLTDASKDFPIWGLGSKVCPGRWHAALVLKMALVQLLKEYDFRLENEGARLKWWWETFQMPYESTRVAFRKRER